MWAVVGWAVVGWAVVGWAVVGRTVAGGTVAGWTVVGWAVVWSEAGVGVAVQADDGAGERVGEQPAQGGVLGDPP
ncbi:hypothetical protein ACFP6A_14420, partial [Quadrisphaera sp. GCM10027208]